MNIVENDWKRLENKIPKGEELIARLAFPEKTKKLYIGIDSNKSRHLLIPLRKNNDEFNDSDSRGLLVVTRDLSVKDSLSKRYIDIICNDSSGHAIFDAIGTEIAKKLDKSEPKDVAKKVIDKWRYFWGKPPRNLMSREEIIGLFAEIWFLYYWLLPHEKKNDAISKWRGPFSSRHDFEWKGKSVEIKATTGLRGRSHKINGIDQLSPPENGKLFLFSLKLREEHGAENTLPNIIELCREKLKNDIDAISKFENILAVSGYSPLHDDEYSKITFRAIDEKLYEVKDGFPRLTEDSLKKKLPDTVNAVEYSINLDGADSFCIATSPMKI